MPRDDAGVQPAHDSRRPDTELVGRLGWTHPEPLTQFCDGLDLGSRKARLALVGAQLPVLNHVCDGRRVHAEQFRGLLMGDRVARFHELTE